MLDFCLKKEWYEKIRKGEKKIEYRLVKPFWNKRIYNEVKKEFRNRFKYNLDMPDSALLEMQKHLDPVLWDQNDMLTLPCILRLGRTKTHMTALIEKCEILPGENTDLKTNKMVWAFHLTEIKEEK